MTPSQVKELPTLKDMDFLNKNQKVYIGEEEKKVFLEKLKRDVEVMLGACPGARGKFSVPCWAVVSPTAFGPFM